FLHMVRRGARLKCSPLCKPPWGSGAGARDLAVRERHLLQAISASDVPPAKLVRTSLVDHVHPYRKVIGHFTIEAHCKLISVRSAGVRIDQNLCARNLRG